MQQVIIHPILGEITISKTLRAKRICISIRNGGRIRASMPVWTDMSQVAKFINDNQNKIAAAVERIKLKYPQDIKNQIDPIEIQKLRKAAKEYLPTRCYELAKQVGLKPGNISIRASRTRWGSCSAKNDISLSLFLIKLPDELIDFVILHELCHIVHKNHSKKFHALLDELTDGHEKELNYKLKHYRPL